MTVHCLIYEAGSIQSYLTDTGRLAEAVTASQLVAWLTGDLVEVGEAGDSLLGRAISALGLTVVPACDPGTLGPGELTFSRRGGGSFVVFTQDAAARDALRWLWLAQLRCHAPGLAWSDGTGSDASCALQAERAARAEAALRKNLPSAPVVDACPLVRRVPRTGKAAVSWRRLGAKGAQALDARSEALWQHARGAGHEALARCFSPQAGLAWPINLSTDDAQELADGDAARRRLFPYLEGQHEIAVLHADGNGLGLLLQKLLLASQARPQAHVRLGAAFSLAVSQATQEAARRATEAVLLPACDALGRVPARPLVLGGDDLGMILRPDVAVPFTRAFLESFEEASARQLAPLAAQLGEPLLARGLSAAAGIAIVHASHPLSAATALAEELCGQTKRAIKGVAARDAMPPSALSLRRVTAALDDQGQPRPSRGLPAYVLGDHPAGGLPRLADLEALAGCLTGDAVGRGALRELLSALDAPDDVTRRALARWRNVLARRSPTDHARATALLHDLGVPADAELPCVGTGAQALASPLADALLLRAQLLLATPELDQTTQEPEECRG